MGLEFQICELFGMEVRVGFWKEFHELVCDIKREDFKLHNSKTNLEKFYFSSVEVIT